MWSKRLALGGFVLAALVATALMLTEEGRGQNARRTQGRETSKPAPDAPAPKPSEAEQPPASKPGAAENSQTLPAQQAAKSGFTTCLGILDNTTRDIVKKSPYSAASSWDTEAADTRTFTAVLSIEQPPSVGLVTVSPTKAGCDAVASVIGYFTDSCIVVREARLQGWKLVWDAKTLLGYQAPDSHFAYLVPSGTGCTVIEARIQYGATDQDKSAGKQ